MSTIFSQTTALPSTLCTVKSCKSFIIVVTPSEKFSVIFPEFVFRTGANHGVAGSARKCVFEVKNGAPGANRTRDLLLRRESLYPTELREHLRLYNRTAFRADFNLFARKAGRFYRLSPPSATKNRSHGTAAYARTDTRGPPVCARVSPRQAKVRAVHRR